MDRFWITSHWITKHHLYDSTIDIQVSSFLSRQTVLDYYVICVVPVQLALTVSYIKRRFKHTNLLGISKQKSLRTISKLPSGLQRNSLGLYFYLTNCKSKDFFKISRLTYEQQVESPASAKVCHNNCINRHRSEKLLPRGAKSLEERMPKLQNDGRLWFTWIMLGIN